jgi:ankyrin repeat protein
LFSGGTLPLYFARRGRTALILAAQNDHVRVVELLIAAAADITAKAHGG